MNLTEDRYDKAKAFKSWRTFSKIHRNKLRPKE